jgi:hypothetical protein
MHCAWLGTWIWLLVMLVTCRASAHVLIAFLCPSDDKEQGAYAWCVADACGWLKRNPCRKLVRSNDAAATGTSLFAVLASSSATRKIPQWQKREKIPVSLEPWTRHALASSECLLFPGNGLTSRSYQNAHVIDYASSEVT